MNNMNRSRFWLLTVFLLVAVLLAKSQEWETLSPPPFGALNHGIGFSANGFGYVVSGAETNDVWRYTSGDDSWEQLQDYSDVLRGYGVGDMLDDQGYFGFGNIFNVAFSGLANDLWRFDGLTESYEQLADCPCEPRTHPALIATDDIIFVGLGAGITGDLGDWWAYDIASDTWAEKASFIGANRHHPYQFVMDGYIYLGSGHFSDWYRYDIESDVWSRCLAQDRTPKTLLLALKHVPYYHNRPLSV